MSLMLTHNDASRVFGWGWREGRGHTALQHSSHRNVERAGWPQRFFVCLLSFFWFLNDDLFFLCLQLFCETANQKMRETQMCMKN